MKRRCAGAGRGGEAAAAPTAGHPAAADLGIVRPLMALVDLVCIAALLDVRAAAHALEVGADDILKLVGPARELPNRVGQPRERHEHNTGRELLRLLAGGGVRVAAEEPGLARDVHAAAQPLGALQRVHVAG